MYQSNTNETDESNNAGRFLWKIIGAKATMYLKGTVHITTKNIFPLKNEIIAAFNSCNNFVCEMIIGDEINKIKITDEIIYNKEFIYEDGDSLYNHFDRDKVVELRNYLVKNDICSERIAKKFYKLKPETVKALMLNGLYKNMGIDLNSMGIDHYFINKANEMKKKIIELEGRDFQESLLKSSGMNIKKSKYIDMKQENIKEDLLTTLNWSKFNRYKIFKLIPWINSLSIRINDQIYKSVDEEKIENSIDRESPIMKNRDALMFKKLEKLLNVNDSYFVAVGAAHLLGKGSIIDLLEQKGYKVNRIC